MGVIHRFQGNNGEWDWAGVPRRDYGPARPKVSVRRFISRQDDSCSNYEQHNYEHAVLVLRGRGTVRLGEELFPIQFGDAIFVESDEVHQFRAAQDESLGFMCAVLDKELRETVHGEQTLVMFDDETGEPKP